MSDGATEIVSDDGQLYLSLVVTARNDDHGGNLLGRMQAFVSGWIEQASRFHIPSEIVIVEWNPPEDRPRLKEVLRWPVDFGCCDVRFIEVPGALHRRYAHADALPLYQMIAKNVGIRRSRGRFVLATNIDILFSDELAAFVARRQLQRERMYRIDRHDAMSAVPMDAPLEQQLEYCRAHLIRVNRREGTFSTSPTGQPILAKRDVAAEGSGILFGPGWLPVESGENSVFRWALENAELILEDDAPPAPSLLMDLAPGPGAGTAPLDLEVATDDGRPVARLTIDHRAFIRLHLPLPRPRSLLFRAHNATTPTMEDARILSLRIFQIEWNSGTGDLVPAIHTRPRPLTWWAQLQYVITKLATGGPTVPLAVPVSPRLRRLLRTYVKWGGLTGIVCRGIPHLFGLGGPVAEPGETIRTAAWESVAADFLHTNACGDFTLMAREHWFDLRGYAEFDLFSMNLDSLFCFAAHCGGVLEEVLPEPMRIYHIEHGSGSGWTPEGQAKLFERIAAKGLSYMSNDQVLALAGRMRSLKSPMIFNHEAWGMAEVVLVESSPATKG